MPKAKTSTQFQAQEITQRRSQNRTSKGRHLRPPLIQRLSSYLLKDPFGSGFRLKAGIYPNSCFPGSFGINRSVSKDLTTGSHI